MVPTGLDMAAVIRKLAKVEADDQLDALVLDWSADCRGLCDDSAQLFTAKELIHVQRVANAIKNLFAVPSDVANAATRSVMLRHPRRESALNLLNEYTRDAAQFDKTKFERQQHEGSRKQ